MFNLLSTLPIWRIFSGLVLVAWAVISQAQVIPPLEDQLTISEEEAIALFYQRNLGLIAARLNIDIAEAEQIIAAAIPNPVFSFTVHELAPKAFAPESRGLAVPALLPQIQQLIETAGKRRLRIESSELATEAESHSVTW